MAKKITNGVLFITAGSEFTQMANISAETIKKHSPELLIHLYTDQKDFKSTYIDSIGLIENPHSRSKVDYIHQSPFDRTLYMDADTKIVRDISDIFNVLDRFDLAIAHAHSRNRSSTNQLWRVEIPRGFPQMNGGIILFKKNEKTHKLFTDWEKAYHENNFTKDQVTLRELLWLSDLRMTVLPPEYNIRYSKYLEVWNEEEAIPYILHYAIFNLKKIKNNKKPSVLSVQVGKLKRLWS